ncbi:MAG: hypothetical protein KC733_11010, partial [Candidatus Omnitrophica bacterium]|nr:hypothetical protein [Candidatus Omnitrophota bacterium]
KAIDSVGGGYDERFVVCQDYDLWSRLLKNWRISVLERELHVRRITQNSLSLSSRNIEQKNIAREISLRNLKEIVSKQISDRELNDIYDFMELGQYSKDRDFQQMYYNLKKITECFAQKYQNIFSFSDVRYECLKMVLDKQNHWRGYCSSFGFAVQWSFWSTMKIFFSKFLRKMTLS